MLSSPLVESISIRTSEPSPSWSRYFLFMLGTHLSCFSTTGEPDVFLITYIEILSILYILEGKT